MILRHLQFFLLCIVAVGLFLGITQCAPASAPPSGQLRSLTSLASKLSPPQDAHYILRGENVRAFSSLRKHTVGLFDKKRQTICTAVVINSRHLITAAHCVLGAITNHFVFFDTTFRSDSPFDRLKNVIIHPDYDPIAPHNRSDLALVEIANPLPGDYNPIEVFEFMDVIGTGMPVWVVGFGYFQNQEPQGSGVLRWAIVDITNLHYSTSEFSIDQFNGTGVCRGDSGGPAFIKTPDGLYLVGITSRGTPDCTQSIFTNGSTIKTFIDRELEPN